MKKTETRSPEPAITTDSSNRKRILDWAGPAFPLEVREEAANIFAEYVKGRTGEEIEAYSTELKFGTGGLRGVLGNGMGRMNVWTVGRATAGFCKYLKSTNKNPSIAIAYDSRRMSVEFARTTAGIAASMGLKVYLFDRVTPTPILSFAIRKLGCSGGVVITASHNPPEYNGYKVYLEDGSQMVGEAQDLVEKEIENVSDWSSISFLDSATPLYRKSVHMIGDDILKAYIKQLEGSPIVSSASNPGKKNLSIVYSPLHGTGGPWLPKILSHFGFKAQLVEEQARPDGEFPTVKYPNPEEPEAMHMAEEKARSLGSSLFLATDPDADRLGAGVKAADGSYVLINGNQIGSLMCAFLCEKIAADKKKSGVPWHIFKTIVTTDLQKSIAQKNGIGIRNVLTGFKYIAQQMRLMDESDKTAGFKKGRDRYLFGGEESFGYLPVDFVRDKDSLSSALLLCEIASEVGNLLDYLDQVFLKYGLYLELLKSVTMKGADGQEKIKSIIDSLRKTDVSGWTLGNRRVAALLDYEFQTRNGKKSPEDFKGLPPSNVVQLLLEPEGKLTIRPSGTEPKVKLYVSLKHPDQPASLDELKIARKQLEDELASIAGFFFAKTGLTG